jgi:TPR repeat protein
VAKGKKRLKTLAWAFCGISALASFPLWGEYILASVKRATYYQEAVDGDVNAQYDLATSYRSPHYMFAHNPEKAFYWDIRAAKQGHPDAMYHAAWAYELGYGTEQDLGEAHKWFREAAALGHKNSRKKLDTTDPTARAVE